MFVDVYNHFRYFVPKTIFKPGVAKYSEKFLKHLWLDVQSQDESDWWLQIFDPSTLMQAEIQ